MQFNAFKVANAGGGGTPLDLNDTDSGRDMLFENVNVPVAVFSPATGALPKAVI